MPITIGNTNDDNIQPCKAYNFYNCAYNHRAVEIDISLRPCFLAAGKTDFRGRSKKIEKIVASLSPLPLLRDDHDPLATACINIALLFDVS